MRLEVNYGGNKVQNTNTWSLKNTLLNNQEITEKVKEEITNYPETNDNKNMTIQNLWDTAKSVLRRKFIAIQSYHKKQETSQINNLTLHLQQIPPTKDLLAKILLSNDICLWFGQVEGLLVL